MVHDVINQNTPTMPLMLLLFQRMIGLIQLLVSRELVAHNNSSVKTSSPLEWSTVLNIKSWHNINHLTRYDLYKKAQRKSILMSGLRIYATSIIFLAKQERRKDKLQENSQQFKHPNYGCRRPHNCISLLSILS